MCVVAYSALKTILQYTDLQDHLPGDALDFIVKMKMQCDLETVSVMQSGISNHLTDSLPVLITEWLW